MQQRHCRCHEHGDDCMLGQGVWVAVERCSKSARKLGLVGHVLSWGGTAAKNGMRQEGSQAGRKAALPGIGSSRHGREGAAW